MNTPTLWKLLVLAFLAIPSLTQAEVPCPDLDGTKLAAVPEHLKQMIDQHEIAGAVILVATRNQAVAESVGLANVAANEPMKPDSMFWIASMTKPVTATCVLMLQDNWKLSVDDPVAKYLPEFNELKTPSGKPANLTLRHLLTHTSGMDNADAETRDAKTLAELIPAYVKKTTHFEPGSKWEYCQSAINTLGRIIEVVSDEPYDQFVQKHVLDPLGMKDTTFYPTKEQLPRIAKSYKKVNDSLEESPISFLTGKDPTSHDRAPRPNGGLFSTAGDYGRFCQMLLDGGTVDGKVYLKPETFKLMTTIQTGDIHTGFTEGNGWGLGVCVVRQPRDITAMLSPGTFGHGGAYGTQAWVDPVKGVAYVLMVQRANFPNSDDSPVRKAFQEAAAAAVK